MFVTQVTEVPVFFLTQTMMASRKISAIKLNLYFTLL